MQKINKKKYNKNNMNNKHYKVNFKILINNQILKKKVEQILFYKKTSMIS